MEELAQHIGEQTQLLFGAAVDHKLEGRLGVTLISSLGSRAHGASAAISPAAPSSMPTPTPRAANVALPIPAMVGAAASETSPAAVAARANIDTGASDNAVRGRFDKSEPTIIDGEDLDVPTFMRKNLKVK